MTGCSEFTGRKNAYLSEVVVRDPSCQGDLQLAQLMLSTAAYTKWTPPPCLGRGRSE